MSRRVKTFSGWLIGAKPNAVRRRVKFGAP